MTASPVEARRIQLRGRVQGVGFRPFVFRLATGHGLAGAVSNSGDGVIIEVQGSSESIESFLIALQSDFPPGASIEACNNELIPVRAVAGFNIEPSRDADVRHARIPVDSAPCAACRAEVADSADRRSGYPFNACSDCGPRYSVIERLPYDRSATTMRHFALCPACRAEYTTPSDRRFHAQAIACPECGPRVTVRTASASSPSLDLAVQLLLAGKIVAVKGLGGYQLWVRADSESAVADLRRRKHRPTKPFAVMVADLAVAEQMAVLTDLERAALRSPANPIVLVQRRAGTCLASAVAPLSPLIGLFLSSTPMTAILLANLGTPAVVTSGNATDEPPAICEQDAHERLAGIADAFADHDRDIVRRLDDSVVRVMAGRAVSLRVGRGYAPLPLPMPWPGRSPAILAVGGHMKSAIAVSNGDQCVLSQHLGDLDDPLSRAGFESTAVDLSTLLDSRPEMIATDRHPDYFPTRWALGRSLPVEAVQHHHAHAAAVQLEHGILDRPALAVTWDGTGLGDDGTLWGGEFLLTSPTGAFERVESLRLIPLLGGEAAIRQPARIAFAMLREAFGSDFSQQELLLSRLAILPQEADMWSAVLERGIQVVMSSAVGRMLDGLGAIVLGINRVTFDGEIPLRLEGVAQPGERPYPWLRERENGMVRVDWRSLVRDVVGDLAGGVAQKVIAGRIHSTLATWVASVARDHPRLPLVLAGGCFQNRLLTEQTRAAVTGCVFSPATIPPGDGGLAAGQWAVAMQRLRSGSHVSRNSGPAC
ncbi:MAG: carbamoyltransferase HypF [Gemmataceae bacterium]|nr:carbamoyltransferase HypF [Gemmataceae bacterium]